MDRNSPRRGVFLSNLIHVENINHIDVGKKGEEIACRYLKSKGHHIVERNFRKKFGEIDIVSRKGNKVYICEVKTFAYDGRNGAGSHRPEDNVTPWKLKKLSRVVQIYLVKKFGTEFPEWEFLVASVVLDMERRIARIKIIADVLA